MNRRNFLGSLAVLPFFGSLVKGADTNPKKVVMSSMYGYLGDDIRKLMILNPAEMRRNGLTPVETPCFIENRIPYCVKTWRLKTYCDGAPDMRAIIGAKRLVLFEIQRLQLTHVYCVAFNPAPIWMHDGAIRYAAFVRGCRLKPWDSAEHVASCPPDSYDARTTLMRG